MGGLGVRVNAVAPSHVDTDLSNVTVKVPCFGDRWIKRASRGRMPQPRKLASVTLFLATEASSGMTGSVPVVDSGCEIR